MNCKELEKLVCEVLRLRLGDAKLAMTGNKVALAERLYLHHQDPSSEPEPGQAGRSSDHHHNYAADLIIINNNFGKLGVLFRCWWNRFFPSWNERYMYQSSSIPTGRMQRPSTYLQMLMGTLGYGAYFNGAWVRSDYDFCSTHHRKPLPGTA